MNTTPAQATQLAAQQQPFHIPYHGLKPVLVADEQRPAGFVFDGGQVIDFLNRAGNRLFQVDREPGAQRPFRQGHVKVDADGHGDDVDLTA